MNKLFNILLVSIIVSMLAACSDSTPELFVATSHPAVQEKPVVIYQPVSLLSSDSDTPCMSDTTTDCYTPVPTPCRPNDTSCKVLFCQPIGNCPLDEKPTIDHLPKVDSPVTDCQSNLDSTCE